MPGIASPRLSRFSHLSTPYQVVAVLEQPQVLLSADHKLVTWEKWLEVSRVVCYFLGSLLFLLGSIYFYPKLTVYWDGNAAIFASWCYMIGCCFFFAGANLDFIQVTRYNHSSQLRQVLRAFNGVVYYMAASIFILGALYFMPTWYPKAPAIGCWAFLIGSILFCVGAFVDIIFICMTHEDPNVSGFRIKNIFCWAALAAMGTFIGAVLFILGSWWYLPRFINLVDDGTYYMNLACTCFTVGSVLFLINAFALIPDVYAGIKTSSDPAFDKESKV